MARWTSSRSIFSILFLLSFSLRFSIAGPAPVATAICDPPGPPPRFACQWSTDTCEWFCPVCDPFGPAPRPSCTWDGSACNWRCDGYTGVDVTVRTLQAPAQNATVYVRLSSLCTATGQGAMCNGQFAVHPGMSVAQKCQAIADTIASQCTAAGYAITVNECALGATFTASNIDCPATGFALGISNSSSTFDQTWQGALPDGEREDTTGTSASCAPIPGPVSHVRLDKAGAGQGIALHWDDAANADDYLVLEDSSPGGAFSTVVGTAQNGAQGWTSSMPSGVEFFLVAARNGACGVGPRR